MFFLVLQYLNSALKSGHLVLFNATAPVAFGRPQRPLVPSRIQNGIRLREPMAAASLNVSSAVSPHPPLTDSHGRTIHDLRVSITDRCNYKCVYCRTGEVGAQYAELSNEEYLRLIRLFVSLGITKVRLTGGEPLLRRGVVELVEELARLRTPAGEPLDLALTTNGHMLESLAGPLKAAGLNRVTVSMDAVDATVFEQI